MDFGFIAIPAITVIVYLVAYVIRSVATNERLISCIPAICGTLGAVLGVVAYFCVPSIIDANDWMTALAIGVVSGFAATGINQIFKQASKIEAEDNGEG